MSKTNFLHSHIGETNRSHNKPLIFDNAKSSDAAKEVATEVVKNIFDNVINRKDIHLEGTNNLGCQESESEPKLKTNDFGDTTPLSPCSSLLREEVISHEKEFRDVPIVKDIKETDLSLEKQLDCLVEDIHTLNHELKQSCGIDTGISQFLEGQGDFTKEILDAYLTSTDLTKEKLQKYFKTGIEQKRANHDIHKKQHGPQNLNVRDEVFENYVDERVLSITQLDWPVIPENIPLPEESDEELEHPVQDKAFLKTVAEIHASLVGDQRNIITPECTSLAPSVKDAGECKVARPVPKPEPSEPLKSNQEGKEKKKKGLRHRLRNFFGRTPSFTSHSNKSQQ